MNGKFAKLPGPGAFLPLILLLTMVWPHPAAAQLKPTVKILGGAGTSFCRQVEKTLGTFLLEMNRLQKGKTTPDRVAALFSGNTRDPLKLLANTRPYTARKNYELNLVQAPEGGWEVRGIKVRVDVGDLKVSPIKYLIATLDGGARLTGLRFSLPQHDYQELLEAGEDRVDSLHREEVLAFLEVFLSAYNKKNIDYLERIYSDDALIIVGTVVEPRPEFNDLAAPVKMTSPQVVKYRRVSKQDYIKALRRWLLPAGHVDIRFEDIHIMRHRTMPNVYGVKLAQHWEVSDYQDDGFLFLTIYFQENDHPLVLVRVWQNTEFAGPHDVSVYDFDIIN